jgi:hypothetical protein
MSAEIHHELPLIASVSNTTESGIRTAKYMIRPRRARSRILLSAASNAGDVLKLNDIPFPRIVVPVNYLAMVAEVALSHNDKNDCRDAKDDSYTEGLIVNWEIIWRSGRKERYPLESTAET